MYTVTGTVSTNHNLSEEKGEPKRYRTEVLVLYEHQEPGNVSLTLRASLSGTSSPNSPRTGYATEAGALFISAQLSTDAVVQRPPKGLGINKTVQAT